MKVELSPSCQHCDHRPANEIAVQKGTRLERAAENLGFTVTEGSVICNGKEPRPDPFDPACGALLTPPDLASQEERERIANLAELDKQASRLFDDTQALIRETLGR